MPLTRVQDRLRTTRKRPCVSRWRPKLRKSKLPPLRLKSNESKLSRKPDARRRRRPIAGAKKKKNSAFKRKRPNASVKKRRRRCRCVRCRSSRHVWRSNNVTSN